ncbi:MAG: flagellar assembly protein A, partial [Dehalococcoidia bacterium]
MADDRLHFAGFDVAFRGRSVDVIVLPRATDEPPPTVDAIVAALKRTPLERAPLDLIGRALEAAVDQASEVRIPVGQVSVTPDESGAPCAIVLSADALAAYAVPATQIPRPQPPAATAPLEAGSRQAPADLVEPAIMAIAAAPRVVSASLLRRMLETAKVTVGILDGAVDAFGMGAPLTRITCLAVGEAPVAGVDGTLEYHFDRSPRLNPRHREDGSVDFHAMLVERFLATDAVLVTRHPVVPELPGQNVLGDRLLAPAAKDVA